MRKTPRADRAVTATASLNVVMGFLSIVIAAVAIWICLGDRVALAIEYPFTGGAWGWVVGFSIVLLAGAAQAVAGVLALRASGRDPLVLRRRFGQGLLASAVTALLGIAGGGIALVEVLDPSGGGSFFVGLGLFSLLPCVLAFANLQAWRYLGSGDL